jgi:hypothetical protein
LQPVRQTSIPEKVLRKWATPCFAHILHERYINNKHLTGEIGFEVTEKKVAYGKRGAEGKNGKEEKEFKSQRLPP